MTTSYHTGSYNNAAANHSFHNQYAHEETPFDRHTPAYYLHKGSYLRLQDEDAAPSNYTIRPGDEPSPGRNSLLGTPVPLKRII